MIDKSYLYTPGPTPIPPRVTAAMGQPIVGHRGESFAKLHGDVISKARKVFQSEADIFVLTQSGTGGLETAVANTVSQGDRVLAIVTGNFGERFAKIAEAYGADVTRVEFEWGTACDVNRIEEVWKEQGPFRLVVATHNETSTGVVNDIAALGRFFAGTDAVFAVDAVSSMGAMDVRTDEWQVDIMITGSQKGLMLPPGLALLSVSEKAWAAVKSAKNSRFYFDLLAARKSMKTLNTAWTPAVSLLYGLNASFDMILEEGLENVFARHRCMALSCRAAIKALGFRMLPREEEASYTVTAVVAREDVSVGTLLKTLREKYSVTFAGGQGKLKGRIFRIGHMGYCTELDVIAAIAALERALSDMGVRVKPGIGLSALQETAEDKVRLLVG